MTSRADHVIPLDPEADFALWREFVVRSPGFPAAWATELGSESAVHATRVYLDAMARRDALVATLRAELRDEQMLGRSPRKLLKRLASPRLPELAANWDAPLRARAAALVAEHRAVDEALDELAGVHARELSRLTAALVQTLRRGRLREAIAWESLGALGAIDKLLATPSEPLDSKRRRRCYRALKYLQRLCVKNDSIGFFGPIAWGTFDDDEPDVGVEHGEPLIARHEHYFETWALNQLARTIDADPQCRQWLPVRRLPSIAIAADRVKFPLQPPAERGAAAATALSIADGTVDSRGLVAELTRRGLANAKDAQKLVEGLAAEGLLFRSAEVVPSYGAETALRACLERMPAVVGAPHRERLDKIEAARSQVAAACGDADALRAALLDAERIFERETGQPGRRGGGGFYEARTPLFQEAERNVSLRLGRRLLGDLREPMAVILRVVRWYTQTIAKRLNERARLLLTERGVARIEFLQAFAELGGDIPSIARDAAGETKQRWRDAIVPLAVDGMVDARAARAAIDAHFPRLPVCWELSRHASPDLMIAADGMDAIRSGDYVIVLGELHVALNTLLVGGMFWPHDLPMLLEWTRRDVASRPIVGDWKATDPTVRTARPYGIYGTHWFIPHSRNMEWRDESVVPLAALYVESSESGEVMGRCEERTWSLADMFNPVLSRTALDAFQLSVDDARRLQIGRLVVQRARWLMSGTDRAFAKAAEPWQRFAALHDWMRRERVPRHVFVKLPREQKPIYFDFHSPLYVELFAKLVRNHTDEGVPIAITEMLPDPDQLWLTDRDDNRYTTEIRCVAVDHG